MKEPMMTSPARMLLGFLLVMPLVGQAAPDTQPATRAAPPPPIRELLDQLSADDWPTRDAARRQLVEMRDDAVPYVRALHESTSDPDLHMTTSVILSEIAAEQLTGPTLVSMDVTNLPLPDALEILRNESGQDVNAWPPNAAQGQWGRVTIRADREPFWSVVLEMCRQAHVWPRVVSADGGLSLARSSRSNPPIVQAGPFIVTAVSAYESNQVEYGDPPNRTRNRTLNLEFCAEPKLRILSRQWQPEITSIELDDGTAVTPPPTREGLRPAHGSGNTWTTQVSLPTGANQAERLATLAGQVRVLAQDQVERLEIENLSDAKGTQYTVAGVRFTLTELVLSDNAIRITFNITNLDRLDPNIRNGILGSTSDADSISLFDAAGRTYGRMGGASTSQTNNELQVVLSFVSTDRDRDKPGPPARLVWDIPVSGRELIIPFEFHDLDLP